MLWLFMNLSLSCNINTKKKKKMKTNFIAFVAVAAIMLSANTNVQAQDSNTENNSDEVNRGEFGIRYMPTFTKLDLRDSKGNDIKGTLKIQQGFGIKLAFNLSSHVGIQAEVNYSRISQKFKDQDINREVNIRYINIPLLFVLNTSKSKQFNLNVVAGPEFGFNTGANLSSNGGGSSDTLSAVIVLKKGNVGFAYGAGMGFALNESHSLFFEIGYRGFYSFVDVETPATGQNSYNVVARFPRARHGLYAGFTVQF